MIGGGFIGQMMDTMKNNRALLGKSKRTPFEKSDYAEREGTTKLVDHKKLSDSDRLLLLEKLKQDAQRENRKKLAFVVISIALTVLLVGLFLYMRKWPGKFGLFQ